MFGSTPKREAEDEEVSMEQKVRLVMGSDQDHVRNLPTHKIKRSSRKRVKSWTQKTLSALMVAVMAYTTPIAQELQDVVIEPVKDVYYAFGGRPNDESVAILELFAGSANLTTEFAKRGHNVLEPRDIRFGHDLTKLDVQEQVLRDIEYYKPKLLWVALPCTKWSPWQRINYAGRQNQLKAERKKERKLVRFAARAAVVQLANGGDIGFEHPEGSDMWEDSTLDPVTVHPDVISVSLDMCRFNLRAKSDGGLLKKPTALLVSRTEYSNMLSRLCDGQHPHTPTAGQNTKPAGVYTVEFCKAVVRAYEQTRRHNIWDSYVARQQREAWHSYVAGDMVGEGGDHQGDHHHGGERHPEPLQLPPGLRHGAEGITFAAGVPKRLANILKRVHQNMGHPSNADLARHLQLAGASTEAVKAVKDLHCETCKRSKQAGTRRPAKLTKPLDFNQEVALDTLHLYDQDGNKITVLSMLDLASGYHLVARPTGRTSEELADVFLSAWVSWAGPPQNVTVDQERGFMHNFTDKLEGIGCTLAYTAGQAHWKQGAVERQGQWYRHIWEKVCQHKMMEADDIDFTLAEVAAAKNRLRRVHGFSPSQWLFGTEFNVGDPMLDEDLRLHQRQELQPPGAEWQRRQKIRQTAREEFIRSQAHSGLQRAVLGRPRVRHEGFEAGDFVYIYRVDKTAKGVARSRQNAGEWIGPGIIVGKEGNLSYWVSRGGRCLLCAEEHLRLAESEELGAAFQTKALKDDLQKLITNMEEDNPEIFADATGSVSIPPRTEQRVPEKRMKTKGPANMVDVEVNEEVNPEAGQPSEALAVHHRIPKALQKQKDKEIPWNQIPEKEKPLYLEAEKAQWDQHDKYGAVRVLGPEETAKVRKEVPPERILKSRFAYRDKNVAKRRLDPKCPCKAKARLCIGGHRDPDLASGGLLTEAPTASKMAFATLLFWAAQFRWRLAAADIEAAFLNGVECKRGLYCEQPERGLPGVAPGVLLEVIKGIFGLSTSPRLWWEKLAKELKQLQIHTNGETLTFQQHELDVCYFVLRDEQGNMRGGITTHVDDLLIAAPEKELQIVQDRLKEIFPVGSWEADDFEYTGSRINQNTETYEITVSQEEYVDSRLETVEIPRNADPEHLADQVTKQDNMSAIGALSWLASQTRPDLQAAVSMAQRKQKNPTYQDVKETNRAVRMAQSGKRRKISYKKLDDMDEPIMLVYHDAAWANVPLGQEEDELTDLVGDKTTGIYSQLGHIVVLTEKKTLEGKEGTSTICAWKSHACQRVCRSTFAAETMSALEGIEEAMAMRAMLNGAMNGNRDAVRETSSRELMPIIAATDCKSVYDAVHRLGGPRAPSEKRLMIDLAGLRQLVHAEQQEWGNVLPTNKSLRWIPTDWQRADALTKIKVSVEDWWQKMETVKLPFALTPEFATDQLDTEGV